MWLCERDFSKECKGNYKDCTDCILDKIKDEIERMDYLSIEDGSDGYDNYVDRYDVLQIIDKHRK